jgi:predicted nucleic acid-binding protein
MKIPNIFVPEKDLEKKILELVEESRKKNVISSKEVKNYYQKFINLKENKKFTVENVQEYFKELSYESALKIVEYEKRERDRFLEGLADIP